MVNTNLSSTKYPSLLRDHEAGICGGWCSYCFFESSGEEDVTLAPDRFGGPLYHLLLDYKVVEILIALLVMSALSFLDHVK